MKILFVGKKNIDYNRVRVILAGLKKMPDVEVAIYVFGKRRKFNAAKFRELQKDADFVYVPPFRHRDVAFIKKHTDKPVIFDPIVSKFLTKLDYGHWWKAPFKYLLDWIPFIKADILLADTEAHKAYFVKMFRLNAAKVHTLYIGVDSTDFFSTPKTDDGKFHVGFYGSLVPLQGGDIIVKAAKLLKNKTDIVFDIIGPATKNKKIYNYMLNNDLTNIVLHGWVDYHKMNALLNKFDLCLGIFGSSKKADIVIPNKIYHYSSINKCTITKETKGVLELFTNDTNIALCQNNPEALAQRIMELKADTVKRERIANASYKLITEEFSELRIAERFYEILNELSMSSPRDSKSLFPLTLHFK